MELQKKVSKKSIKNNLIEKLWIKSEEGSFRPYSEYRKDKGYS